MAAVSPTTATTAKVYLCVKATLTVSAAVVNTPVLFNTFFVNKKQKLAKTMRLRYLKLTQFN